MSATVVAAFLLAALVGSRAAPSPPIVQDEKVAVLDQSAANANTTKEPKADGALRPTPTNATGKPTTSGSKQTYGYFYYYTDEMWYVNPTSYVGTLGFICVAVVLHIIVCTMRQKPGRAASRCSVAPDLSAPGADTPPPPYRLFYKSLPPPPDYDTAAKLPSPPLPQPPPNYNDIVPVHRVPLA